MIVTTFLSTQAMEIISLGSPHQQCRMVQIKAQEEKLARIERFIEDFNALPEDKKIMLAKFGVFNNPATRRLREEFSDCTDAERQQISCRLKIPITCDT